jgi:hypothetical protein
MVERCAGLDVHRDNDVNAIGAVTTAAFRQTPKAAEPPETKLPTRLRADVGWLPRLSLVAVADNVVIGHLMCRSGFVDTAPALASADQGASRQPGPGCWTRPDGSAVHEPRVAGALNNLSNRFWDAGRHEESLAPSASAISLYRRLAAANPAAHDVDLARTLNNSSLGLTQAARHQEAESTRQELVQIVRRDTHPSSLAHTS